MDEALDSPAFLPPAPPTQRGRGAALNPQNRFERIDYRFDPDPSLPLEEMPRAQTIYLRDATREIIAHNDSPDVGFNVSLNPYRGCEHGCAYCFARPTHEYLGFSAGLDFETKIMVKERAPELLERALAAPGWVPQVLGFSGVTDCYQPIERKLELTRRCLAVLARYRNPVALITKNQMITRDIDYLSELARYGAVVVNISVTTLDADLAAVLEPRASRPAARLAAVRQLAEAGIPVNVLMGPVIPGLTDEEIPRVVAAAAAAGARSATYVLLRLPHAVAPLFEDWLERHRPERKKKVLARVRATRGGALYKCDFHERHSGAGAEAEQIADLFEICARRAGLDSAMPPLETKHFRRGREQLDLFGSAA
jgi:DNA repair photolyase